MIALAKIAPMAPCAHCGTQSHVTSKLEEEGSLKLELECHGCGGYQMVRLSAIEVANAKRIAMRTTSGGHT